MIILYNFISQQRNKPKEPPKAPKAAPFFLPTVAGLEPKFAVDNVDEDRSKSKVRMNARQNTRCNLHHFTCPTLHAREKYSLTPSLDMCVSVRIKK